MRLILEGRCPDERHLPRGLGADDAGRTWWIGYIWHIWAGDRWQKAIATRAPMRNASLVVTPP